MQSNKQKFKRPTVARLGEFITAYGRLKLIDTLLTRNCLDDVVQVHTDGFCLTKPLKDLGNSKLLGGLKLEHHGEGKVFHVNKVRCKDDPKMKF